MKALTVGELLDALDRAEATVRRRAVAGLSREQWRAMEIVVRGADEDGADFCGSLRACGVEFAHDDDETLFLALDASNEPVS